MLITLKDFITDKNYIIDVSLDEARRAQDDLRYAEELLEFCKKNNDDPTGQNESEVDGSELIDNTNVDEINIELTPTSSKNLWAYDTTVIFIHSVESHYDELKHSNPHVKKRGWENIINDLASQKKIIALMDLKKKWNNLVQSYNKAKDLKQRTGKGPIRFHFFEHMDAILGSKPSNSSPFSLNIGGTVATQSSASSTGRSTVQEIEASSNSETEDVEEDEPEVIHKTVNKVEKNENVSGPSKLNEGGVKKRKRVIATAEYIKFKKDFYTSLKKEREEARQEKKNRELNKQKRFDKKMELEERKMSLEERKVAVLERYLKDKQDST